MKNNNKLYLIALNGLIGGIYVLFSLILMPLTYGYLQFRASEILTILPFFNPFLGIGVTIGCLITNLYSPFGIIDIVFGTLSTLLTVVFVAKSKTLFKACFYPTIFSFIVACIISYVENTPLLINALSVMSSEFIITFIIAYPLFKKLQGNKKFIEIIEKTNVKADVKN